MHRMSSRLRRFRFERTRRLFWWHSRFTGALFFLYFSFGLLWGPSWLLGDLSRKFEAIAETVTVGAIVLPPPSPPTVSATASCDDTTPVIDLDWEDDDGATSFNLSRDGMLLLSGFAESEAEDRTVSLGGTYSYMVTAYGPMGSGVAASDPVSIISPSECLSTSESEEEESGGSGSSKKKKKHHAVVTSIIASPNSTSSMVPSSESGISEVPPESAPIEAGMPFQIFPALSFGGGILIAWADIVRWLGWIAFVSLFSLLLLLLLFLREYAMYAQSLVWVTEDMIGKKGYVRKEVKR